MTAPSLLISPDRYKAGKLYSQLPQSGAGDFSVVRNTVANRVNDAGVLVSEAANVPRIDFGVSSCPALLVEPAATNLLLRSEEFDNVYWTKGRVTSTTNTSVSPNGTTTADTITDDTTASATHRVFSENVALVSGTSYSSSCFVKAGTSNRVEIRLLSNLEADIGIAATVFDLSNGTVISGSGRIENYGNGWFRCTNTGTSNTTGNGRVFIYLYNSANQRVYTGTATNTMFIWGAQLETGSVATSYIQTVASTQTRNADVISLTGVSSLIGQTQGTLYAEVDVRNFQVNGRILAISDGSSNNRVALLLNTLSRISLRVSESGVAQASIDSSTLSAGVYKVAVAYAANDFVLYVNGAQIGADTSGTVPACSEVFLGKAETSASGAQLNDRIRAAAIYTSRLSNAELAQLTTL